MQLTVPAPSIRQHDIVRYFSVSRKEGFQTSRHTLSDNGTVVESLIYD